MCYIHFGQLEICYTMTKLTTTTKRGILESAVYALLCLLHCILIMNPDETTTSTRIAGILLIIIVYCLCNFFAVYMQLCILLTAFFIYRFLA